EERRRSTEQPCRPHDMSPAGDGRRQPLQNLSDPNLVSYLVQVRQRFCIQRLGLGSVSLSQRDFRQRKEGPTDAAAVSQSSQGRQALLDQLVCRRIVPLKEGQPSLYLQHKSDIALIPKYPKERQAFLTAGVRGAIVLLESTKPCEGEERVGQ